jgi:hypothetical protein
MGLEYSRAKNVCKAQIGFAIVRALNLPFNCQGGAVMTNDHAVEELARECESLSIALERIRDLADPTKSATQLLAEAQEIARGALRGGAA